MLQGDVLSGTLAAFTAWTVNSEDSGAAAAEHSGVPALLLAAYGATSTVRHASEVSLPDVYFPTVAYSVIDRQCRLHAASSWAVTMMRAHL